MEYDSRPASSGMNPLIMIVAGLVVVAVVGALVYFLVLAPSGSDQNASQPQSSASSSEDSSAAASIAASAEEDASNAAEMSNLDSDWRRAFREFQQGLDIQATQASDTLEAASGGQQDALFRLVHGNIQNAPGFTNSRGRVALYRTPQGQWLLRFFDFGIVPGPDYKVTLSSRSVVRAIGDLNAPFHTTQTVGELTQFFGEKIFVLPSDFNPTNMQSVTVWSDTYDVLVASAILQTN